MAQAARTYSTYDYAAPRRSPQQGTRPDISVIPGGEDAASSRLSPRAIRTFAFALVAVVLVSLVIGCRVTIVSATVETLDANEALAAQLDDAQEAGTQLEVQHSILTDPERIREQAEALGMVISDDVTYMTVDYEETCVLNDDGTVSLAKTLSQVGAQAAAAAE